VEADLDSWGTARSGEAARSLPHLPAALDARIMAPRLRALLGAAGDLEVRILKHVPAKRCVLAYEFPGGPRAVAKMYRKDRAERQADRLSCLGAALQGTTRVPRLLACWPELGLVVQEWVPGEPVPPYAEFAAEAALAARLGRALADLHAAPLRVGPRADLASHVRRTCHPGLLALRQAIPGLAAPLEELEREMYARETALGSAPCTCHGDFSPGQLFTHGERVYLLDVDGLCQGDPALDVASFRVGLEVHLGAAGELPRERFLGAYLERRGLETLPGLALYEAFGMLRRAMIAWRKRHAGWEAQLRCALERSRARLATS